MTTTITITTDGQCTALQPDTRLDQILGQLVTITERLTIMSGTEAQLQADLANLGTAVTGLQTSATAIQTEVQALKDQIFAGNPIQASDLAALESATANIGTIAQGLSAASANAPAPNPPPAPIAS